MLILMCLEKETIFVQMPLRSFGNCRGMVAIANSRIVCVVGTCRRADCCMWSRPADLYAFVFVVVSHVWWNCY